MRNFLKIISLLSSTLLATFPLAGQYAWGDAWKVVEIPAASSITADGEDNFYLISTEKTRVYKYLSAFAYDSALVLGGKSHREEGFLEIVDIDVTNRQTAYLLDQGRQRIALIHPNLRVLQELALLQLPGSNRLSRPDDLLIGSMSANSAGELFLLNVLDNRIYVLSSFGEWTLSFGGTDYGAGSIYHPGQIRLSSDNVLYVAEPQQSQFLVFDMYGTFRYRLEAKANHPWTSFQVLGNVILLKGHQRYSLLDPRTSRILEVSMPVSDPIDLFWGGTSVYFLTENAVHLYPVPKEE